MKSDIVLATEGFINALKAERDKAVRSEALYREMFEENNKQRDEIVIENFELKRRLEEVAERIEALRHENDPFVLSKIEAIARGEEEE